MHMLGSLLILAIWYQEASHWGFNLHFCMTNSNELLLYCVCFDVFFDEVSLEVFLPIFQFGCLTFTMLL